MRRMSLAIALGFIAVCQSAAHAQDSAQVIATIKFSEKTPSFADQRLVVTLKHDYPAQPDRGLATVDQHVNAKFSYVNGKNAVLTVTIGEKAKLDPNVHYTLTVFVFDAASKRTHIGEVDGVSGPFGVLNGSPNKATFIVRPLP